MSQILPSSPGEEDRREEYRYIDAGIDDVLRECRYIAHSALFSSTIIGAVAGDDFARQDILLSRYTKWEREEYKDENEGEGARLPQ